MVAGVVALTAFPAAAGTAAASSKSPSPAQIRRAVRHAERSSALWATVNICDTPKFPHVIGIRGEMPALGFGAKLRMTFMIDYAAGNGFKPLRGVADAINLGAATSGVYQGGVRFTFGPHAGALRGRARFSWRVGKRTVGTVIRITTAGHHGASYGDPRGFSAARCSIA
ncbi:MAG TPA: hypothetical protein VLP43_03060 [Solirubrobacteraceae bacterium]|nr:hypothetical protein [Solirubrobacteraceae bacterium]